MAMILLGTSRCSICGNPLREGQDVIGTPHFITDPAHPLWRHSDAGMHRACFRAWDRRDAFRRLFHETGPHLYPEPETRREMTENGDITLWKVRVR